MVGARPELFRQCLNMTVIKILLLMRMRMIGIQWMTGNVNTGGWCRRYSGRRHTGSSSRRSYCSATSGVNVCHGNERGAPPSQGGMGSGIDVPRWMRFCHAVVVLYSCNQQLTPPSDILANNPCGVQNCSPLDLVAASLGVRWVDLGLL